MLIFILQPDEFLAVKAAVWFFVEPEDMGGTGLEPVTSCL